MSFLHKTIAKPSIYVHPDRVLAVEGDEVTVYCNASGVPKPKVTWKSVIGESSKSMITLPNGNLILRRVKKMDSGIYRCTATNSIGSSSKSSFVVVMPGKL